MWENLSPATTRARILGRMSATRTSIAGIPIPDSTLAREVTEFVQDVSPAAAVRPLAARLPLGLAAG
jgi:hypothetical protein